MPPWSDSGIVVGRHVDVSQRRRSEARCAARRHCYSSRVCACSTCATLKAGPFERTESREDRGGGAPSLSRGAGRERATRARRTRGTRAESTTESVAWGARACGRIARAIAFACRSVSLFVRRRVMKTPSGGRGAATYSFGRPRCPGRFSSPGVQAITFALARPDSGVLSPRPKPVHKRSV